MIVNMEKTNQNLMEQMRVTAQLVDEIVNLKVMTIDAQHFTEETKLPSSTNEDLDIETNEQTDIISDQVGTSSMKQRKTFHKSLNLLSSKAQSFEQTDTLTATLRKKRGQHLESFNKPLKETRNDSADSEQMDNINKITQPVITTWTTHQNEGLSKNDDLQMVNKNPDLLQA